MTRFSRPDVHQCPACDGFLLWPNLQSFNTFGQTTTWSDGCSVFSGMLDGCTLRCCPVCRALLWKDDLPVLGQLAMAPRPVGKWTRTWAQWFGDKHGHLRREDEWNAVPDAWKTAEHGARTEYADLQRALLAVSAPDLGRETFIRRRIWWQTNDHLRRRSDGELTGAEPVAPERERRTNMLRLLEIHEISGSDLPLQAELLRQLGRFGDAARLLTSDALEIRDSATAAWTMRWVKAGDSGVKTRTA